MASTKTSTDLHPLHDVVLQQYKRRVVHDYISLAYEIALSLPDSRGASHDFKCFLRPAQEALDAMASQNILYKDACGWYHLTA